MRVRMMEEETEETEYLRKETEMRKQHERKSMIDVV